ncbi:hypothetical protein M5K25_023575 [Dendrobium thyrsiflorum]|uniref:Uncharacterized protein n=1 Tax=Dendrobium thyrsiflorum TaxID=117978 RepID=A0ABD0U8I5_DENTH
MHVIATPVWFDPDALTAFHVGSSLLVARFVMFEQFLQKKRTRFRFEFSVQYAWEYVCSIPPEDTQETSSSSINSSGRYAQAYVGRRSFDSFDFHNRRTSTLRHTRDLVDSSNRPYVDARTAFQVEPSLLDARFVMFGRFLQKETYETSIRVFRPIRMGVRSLDSSRRYARDLFSLDQLFRSRSTLPIDTHRRVFVVSDIISIHEMDALSLRFRVKHFRTVSGNNGGFPKGLDSRELLLESLDSRQEALDSNKPSSELQCGWLKFLDRLQATSRNLDSTKKIQEREKPERNGMGKGWPRAWEMEGGSAEGVGGEEGRKSQKERKISIQVEGTGYTEKMQKESQCMNYNAQIDACQRKVKDIPGTMLTQAASFSLTILSASFLPAYQKDNIRKNLPNHATFHSYRAWPTTPSLSSIASSSHCTHTIQRRKSPSRGPFPCMADQERDHGFMFDLHGRVDVLRSTFFDINPEIDDTIDDYVDRILFTFTSAIEEHQVSGQWRVIGHPPTSSSPATLPLGNAVSVLLLVVASLRDTALGLDAPRSVRERCESPEAQHPECTNERGSSAVKYGGARSSTNRRRSSRKRAEEIPDYYHVPLLESRVVYIFLQFIRHLHFDKTSQRASLF